MVDVLLEELNPETEEFIGRCVRFAPEVDGEVIIKSEIPYQVN